MGKTILSGDAPPSEFNALALKGQRQSLFTAYFSRNSPKVLPDGRHAISNDGVIGVGVKEVWKTTQRSMKSEVPAYVLKFIGSERMRVYGEQLGFTGNGSIASESGEMRVVLYTDRHGVERVKVGGVKIQSQRALDRLYTKGIYFEGKLKKGGIVIIEGKMVEGDASRQDGVVR